MIALILVKNSAQQGEALGGIVAQQSPLVPLGWIISYNYVRIG
jgi:hypothetical protein